MQKDSGVRRQEKKVRDNEQPDTFINVLNFSLGDGQGISTVEVILTSGFLAVQHIYMVMYIYFESLFFVYFESFSSFFFFFFGKLKREQNNTPGIC